MKKIFWFCFFCILNISWADDSLSRFLAVKHQVLYRILSQRCHTYLYSELDDCLSANEELVQYLDIDFVPRSRDFKQYYFISFKNKLINILSDIKTQDYFKALNLELNNIILQKESKFNLFDLTRKFTAENDFRTSELIAVLFQDTSDAMTHIYYLKEFYDNTDPIFQENLSLLEKTIHQMQLVQTYRDKDVFALFFPKHIPKTLSPLIYHYYVPQYLSMLLKEKFSTYISSNVSFLFISTYEFIGQCPNYRCLLTDPPYLQNIASIKDLFNAYSAVQFIKKKPHYMDFHSFHKTFDQPTYEALLILLNQK